MGQANWQRNARALVAGNLLIHIGWAGVYEFSVRKSYTDSIHIYVTLEEARK